MIGLPVVLIAVLTLAPASRSTDAFGDRALPPENRAGAAEDWSEAWQQLRLLRSVATTDEDRSAHLESLRERLAAAEAGPRAELLRTLLARYDGRAVDPPTALALGLTADSTGPPRFGPDDPLSPPELWLAGEALANSPARARVVAAALDAAPPHADEATYGARLRLAWEVGVDEARAGRHADGAHPIQRRLHDLYPAPWSAMDLALTEALLGRSQRADTVLAAEIERARDAEAPVDPELWNRRGLVALGVGHERRGRDYLGRALRLGSTNAAVVLARLDLVQGDLIGARRGFRALSWSADPGAWAQRGYGLALLPARPR